MAERPILFSGPMVRALIAGRKTQTRRAVKPQPVSVGQTPLISFNHGRAEISFGPDDRRDDGLRWWSCPYGQAGDALWVRETWLAVPATAYRHSEGVVQTVNPDDLNYAAIYAAGWDRSIPKWRPSIHMPRWASRLTLDVSHVRVERLQDISEADAIAEGLEWVAPGMWSVVGHLPILGHDPRAVYAELWDHINGAGAWAANPWVWVVSFSVRAAP